MIRNCLFACLVVCSLLPRLVANPQTDVLRVLTFNIRYAAGDDGDNAWTNRKDAVAALINREADIAGLQEVLPEQLQDLTGRLDAYAHVSRTREKSPKKGEACSIFFRKDRFDLQDSGTFWLSQTPDVSGSISWESSLPRICTWVRLHDKASGVDLHVFNVHLDHRSAEARLQGLKLVKTRADAVSGPVILLGDCNSTDDSPELQCMNDGAGWLSAWKTVGVGDGGTFNGWRETGPYVRIDHQWGRGVQPVSCSVIKARAPHGWVSDHFPVLTLWKPLPGGETSAAAH